MSPCFNSLEYIPRNEIAGLYANSMFTCLRNYHTVFHVAAPFYVAYHQQCTRVPISPHLCQNLFSFLKKNKTKHYSHSNRCEILFYYCFDWHFPNDNIEFLFMCHLYIFSREMCLQVLCIFKTFQHKKLRSGSMHWSLLLD